MEKNGFYAVYIEETGDIVTFHNLPLEYVDENTNKVAFTCEGVSHLVINDDINNFTGKENEYIVKREKLRKRSDKEIRQIKLEQELNDIKAEIQMRISSEIPINTEIQLTKRFLEWIQDGQPKGDIRERNYKDMQKTIEKIKKEYNRKKQKIQKELDK